MRRPGNCGGCQCRSAGEHLAQHDGLLAQADGALVIREEVDQLVAKDAGATWFQHHDWNSRADLRFEFVQDTKQVVARLIEEAEVVQRPAAADMLLGNLHAGSRRGEHLRRRRERLRVKVVVPGVGPEQHRFADPAAVTALCG